MGSSSSAANLRIDGYEVIRKLHHGGQGVVFEAIQRSTKRKVAVKVLLEGAAAPSGVLKRFEREIELVAQLNHPHIITVFESGLSTDGRRYYAMDYVHGERLHRYVREQKLDLDETLRLFCRVCEAVHYAHQRGVIHRDLKPSNILVESGGTPKVLDFGLAKLLSAPLDTIVSMTGQLVGTLPYMSPEQVRGKPDEIDARTDVYSLGVILYELLTGQYPYPIEGDLGEILQHIKESPPTPPSRNWTAKSGVHRRQSGRFRVGQCPIDRDLQTMVLTALAKEPAQRYASAGALAEDIGHYLAHEPIRAKRDSVIYVLRKKLRRKRLALAVGTITGLALIAAAYFQRRASVHGEALLDQQAQLLFAEAKLDTYRSPQEALKKCDAALAVRPELLEAQLYRAFLLKRENRYEQATQAAEAILQSYPDSAPAHLLLHQLLKDRNPQRAADHLQRAQRLKPGERYYRALVLGSDQTQEAIALLSDVLDEDGGDNEARWARAWRYFEVGEFEKMFKDAEVMTELQPKVAPAWNTKGIALSRLGRLTEAESAYDKALSLTPDYGPTLLNRADAHVKNGKLKEAMADCDRAIEMNPEFEGAYAMRAWVQYLQAFTSSKGGDLLDSAEADCRRALHLNANLKQAQYYLGSILRRKARDARAVARNGQRDEVLAAAREALDRAIELAAASDPVRTDYLVERGDVERDLGRLDAARDDYSDALLRNPDRSDVLGKRALVWIALKKFDAAMVDADRILAIESSAPGERALAHHLRGDILRRRREYALAILDAGKALELMPDDPRMIVARGVSYWLAGDEKAALVDFEAAVTLAGNSQPLVYLWIWEIRKRRNAPGDIEAAEKALEAAGKAAERHAALGDQFVDQIVKTVRNKLQPGDLASLALTPKQVVEAYYYLGVAAQLDGRESEALANFETCVGSEATDNYEYHLALRKAQAMDRP